MTHPLLTDAEAYAEWEAVGAEIAEARARVASQMLEHRRAEQEALDAHTLEVADAVREPGARVPEPPTPVDGSHLDRAMALVTERERQHQQRRDTVLAAVADAGGLDDLADRERARWQRLVILRPELDALTAEARQDAALTAELLGAVDRQAGVSRRPSRAARIDTRPDLVAMLDAAQTGRSMLEPEPLPVQPGRIQRDLDRDPSGEAGARRAALLDPTLTGARRLGYGRGGGFGNVDTRRVSTPADRSWT